MGFGPKLVSATKSLNTEPGRPVHSTSCMINIRKTAGCVSWGHEGRGGEWRGVRESTWCWRRGILQISFYAEPDVNLVMTQNTPHFIIKLNVELPLFKQCTAARLIFHIEFSDYPFLKDTQKKIPPSCEITGLTFTFCCLCYKMHPDIA